MVAYSLDGLAFDRKANVRAYRLRLVLNVEFRDVRCGCKVVDLAVDRF